MRKVFLSVFVIAASGAYVAHETTRVNAENSGGLDMPATPVGQSAPADAAPSAVRPIPAVEVEVRAEPPAPLPAAPAESPPAVPPPVDPVATATAAVQEPEAEPAPAATDEPPPLAAEEPPAAPLPAPVPIPRLRHARKLPSAEVQTAKPTPASYLQAQYRDGTYRGPIADAYYGLVQVEVTVQGGQVVSVRAVRYPSDRQTSRRINRQALPMLQEEAIAAQSAQVDIISGATLTSRAWRQSLDAALAKAGA